MNMHIFGQVLTCFLFIMSDFPLQVYVLGSLTEAALEIFVVFLLDNRIDVLMKCIQNLFVTLDFTTFKYVFRVVITAFQCQDTGTPYQFSLKIDTFFVHSDMNIALTMRANINDYLYSLFVFANILTNSLPKVVELLPKLWHTPLREKTSDARVHLIS